MLTVAYHPDNEDKVTQSSSADFTWVNFGPVTIHLYPNRLDPLIELHRILETFIQESFNAQSSLSNGDRLDNSRDIPQLPAESLPPVYATLETPI